MVAANPESYMLGACGSGFGLRKRLGPVPVARNEAYVINQSWLKVQFSDARESRKLDMLTLTRKCINVTT